MAYFDPFKTQRAIIADRRLSSSETVTAFVILANRISKTGECASWLCRILQPGRVFAAVVYKEPSQGWSKRMFSVSTERGEKVNSRFCMTIPRRTKLPMLKG